MEETIKCNCKSHESMESIYPQDCVPISLFLNEKNKELYPYCLDCRNYNIELNKHKNQKYIDSIKANADFLFCPYKNHLSISVYPRDKVPILLFKKYPNNPNSSLTSNCLDCRKDSAQIAKQWREDRISNIEENMFWCKWCDQYILDSERAINLNGELSSLCSQCKIKEQEK